MDIIPFTHFLRKMIFSIAPEFPDMLELTLYELEYKDKNNESLTGPGIGFPGYIPERKDDILGICKYNSEMKIFVGKKVEGKSNPPVIVVRAILPVPEVTDYNLLHQSPLVPELEKLFTRITSYFV